MTRSLDFSPRATASNAPSPAFDPRCASPGCHRDGTHGEHVNLRKGQEGVWFCAPHYRERMQGRAAA